MADKDLPTCEFETDSLIVRLDLCFAAEIEAISNVIERVIKIVSMMSCASGKEFEIETSLREALTNAVVHGCRLDPEKKVQLTACCDDARGMLLIVRDSGEGFDIDSIPSPVVGENIFATHGRGIYLINQLMDEVTFRAGGTEIRMRKR